MARRRNMFELKLLTSSKEVTPRRLRSYAASLGGDAAIFHDYDELHHNLVQQTENPLDEEGNTRPASIVLSESSLPLRAEQIVALEQHCRFFVLQRPKVEVRPGRLVPSQLPGDEAPDWRMESYLLCSVSSFLESPIVRMSMAQMVTPTREFKLEHLLRWGHASSTWTAGQSGDISEHGYRFVRNLSLTGGGRRLTEMFNHFIQARLEGLGLVTEALTFGSDGLLVTGIAHCRIEGNDDGSSLPGPMLRDIVEDLRMHEFQIGVVNQLEGGIVEIGGFYYPYSPAEILGDHVVMVFKKRVVTDSAPSKERAEEATKGEGPAVNAPNFGKLNKAG